MNRETESHFSYLPEVNIRRSSFKRPHTHKTSMSAGMLYPIYVDSDIVPGDTVKMDMGSLIRMQTPLFPVMDQAYMDVAWFFVPHRLVWTHFKEFWGENNTTHWEQPVEYTIPQITAPASTGWIKGTLADYMGMPIGVPGISVNHLPFRAYCQIWNDWWRDENLKDPTMITLDETTVTGVNSGTYEQYAEAGGPLLKAAKFKDFFTSALPSPQKGPSVNLPLGKTAPIIGAEPTTVTGYTTDNTLLDERIAIYRNGSWPSIWKDGDPTTGIPDKQQIALAADLSNAIGATINQLRESFAIQAFYEAQASGGSRYVEFCKAIFGVTSPDARLQRSEYLGGQRISINMDQVLQTSATDATSPQGNTAAFSCTVSTGNMFTHSFTEHGTLMCLAVIRTDHTYQQGIEMQWLRKKKFDFYIPQMANLGEEMIPNACIYATGTSTDEQAFGYQERWAEYKYKPSRISGCLRSTYAQATDFMHYGDEYATLPTLSSGWIDETVANIDRTIAVPSTTEDQFFCDFYFDGTYVRPMPVYSTPATLSHF